MKAIIFDFIGTLTHVTEYSREKSKLKLYKNLVKSGFNAAEKEFLDAYDTAYEECRLKRYNELIEVTDAVWVAEALRRLGFQIDPGEARVKAAISSFYENYFSSLELNDCAEQLLRHVSRQYKTGLISNFTYSPVIHAAMRKLKVNWFFNVALVSQEVGWRKPNKKIFQEALKRLDVDGKETVYMGDCPMEDIGGASAMGMHTIFVPSQFYSLEDLKESDQEPDLIVENICELQKILSKFIKNLQEKP